MSSAVEALDRAVTVHAPASLVYRWMCQLSLAPYSYDFIDNWGRRSPRRLVPGSDELTVGQRMMVFVLADVQPGHQFSLRSHPSVERLFGRLAATYAAESVSPAECRLICRILTDDTGILRGPLLAWGDLVMMRKQLLNFKKYAERDNRVRTAG
jgi:hypothetical protein